MRPGRAVMNSVPRSPLGASPAEASAPRARTTLEEKVSAPTREAMRRNRQRLNTRPRPIQTCGPGGCARARSARGREHEELRHLVVERHGAQEAVGRGLEDVDG